MTVTLRPPRVRLALFAAIVALGWALMAASVWGILHFIPDDGSDLRVPLAGAREVRISLWSRDNVLTFWPGATGSARRPGYDEALSSGSLSVAIWYQDLSAARSTRLALFKLPAWSLGLIALDLAIVAICLSVRLQRLPREWRTSGVEPHPRKLM